MANPTYFSGQKHAGFPKQMPKDAADEAHKLDDMAVDPQGRLWVLYSKNVGTYILYYQIYTPSTDSWAAKVEVYPDGTGGATYSSYGSGKSQIVANRVGDMMIAFTDGTNAGNAIQKVRVIRNDGTKEAISNVPNAGGNLTNAATIAVNECFDWGYVDGAGTLAAAGTYRVRVIEYDSTALTWGNERFLYDSNMHGTYQTVDMYRKTASYSPIDDKVHVCTQVKAGALGTEAYQLMYCADGIAPTFATIPNHAADSVAVYPFPNVCLAMDNIEAGRGYITLQINAYTTGNEDDVNDSSMFREIVDYQIQGLQTPLYFHNHSASGILGAENYVPILDGTGNVHVILGRDGIAISATETKFTSPVPSVGGRFGTSYARRLRSGPIWSGKDDTSNGDEVFYDADTDDSNYAQQAIAKPFPGHETMFVGGVRSNASGGSVTAEEGVWINYADVLGAAIAPEGGGPVPNCAGQDVLANDVAHRQFLFDERSFSPLQDDVGVQ